MRLPIPPALGALLIACFPLAAAGLGQAAPPSPSAPSLSASTASPPASSSATVGVMESSPEQVVWLRSGAVLRGRIVEYEPDKKVVLQLATGEIRAIAWSEVSKASWITSAPSSSASGSARPLPRRAAQQPPRAAGSVVVRIAPADPRLWLESRPRFLAGDAWQRTCQAPCGRRIYVEDRSLRIAGDGLHPSNPFHVQGEGDTVKLNVRAGNHTTHLWGRGLFAAGIGVAIASGALYGLGRVQDEDAMAVSGIVGMVAGGVMLLGSLPILFAGRTTVVNADGRQVGSTRPSGTGWPVF